MYKTISLIAIQNITFDIICQNVSSDMFHNKLEKAGLHKIISRVFFVYIVLILSVGEYELYSDSNRTAK